MRCLSLILLLLLSLQSCFKEEALIPPHDQGDLEEGQAALGFQYENQVYFDLNTGEDSTWSHQYVYLVDRGVDQEGSSLGQKKVQFDIRGEAFQMRFANPDNSGDTTVLILRDPAMDQVYYSFDEGMMDIAPLPDQWSLLFTRYTTMLVTDEGEDYPYLVVGVLLNPNEVGAALDTIHDFMDMTADDITDLEYTSRADVVGYEWKYYDFDAGVYTIVPDMNYVIRDRDGYFYKLRFVDFYSDEGVKGYPSFEFVRL